MTKIPSIKSTEIQWLPPTTIHPLGRLRGQTVTDMVEPESGKPDNVNVFLGSLAGLCAALSAWLYRRSGKVPRPEPKPSDGRWDEMMSKLEEIDDKLSGLSRTVEDIDERVIRHDERLKSFGRRLATIEGHQEPAGD